MNEFELWRELKSGDKKALERIYSVHVKALLKYGRKFCVDAQMVEDCVQDLFIDIWNTRKRLGDTDSIKRYLFVSLRRKIFRQLQRSPKHISPDESLSELFDAEMVIDDRLIQMEISTERLKELKTALQQLSKRQQESLYLKYFAEMDYKDISEIMEINYQSARNLIFNALKALRKSMLPLLFLQLFAFLKNI